MPLTLDEKNEILDVMEEADKGLTLVIDALHRIQALSRKENPKVWRNALDMESECMRMVDCLDYLGETQLTHPS